MNTTLRLATLLTMAALIAAPTSTAAVQERGAAAPGTNAEAIHEHIDEAEEALEMLLDWRHVLTAATSQPRDTTPPTEPATTLISVPRSDVERLTKLLDAVMAMVPKPPQAGTAPRGDLRAHAEKAQEIARELLPAASTQPVGTSGRAGDAGIVVVDRAALERLEVEIDAMERVAPRRLSAQ
jgi:hypothetical protein